MSKKLSGKIASKVQGSTLEKEKVTKVTPAEQARHKGVGTGWGGMQYAAYATTEGKPHSQKEHSSFMGKSPKYIDTEKAIDKELLYKGKKSGK